MQWLLRSGQSLLYMYFNRQHFYWLHNSACMVSYHHSPLHGQYERVCGRVQEYLHGGPLQAGLRLRWWHEWKSAAPGEARREVQVLKASLPSPVEGESARFQLAAKIQTKEMDFRRYYSGTDSWYSPHSARWVNKSPGSKHGWLLAASHKKGKRKLLHYLITLIILYYYYYYYYHLILE